MISTNYAKIERFLIVGRVGLNKTRVKLTAIAVSALVLVIALSSYLLYQPLMWFDQSGQLQAQVAQGQVGERLGQWLRQKGYKTDSRVFHVMDTHCMCNWRTEAHKQVVKRKVNDSNGTNVELSLNELPMLRHFLPATPAVVIFDANSELVYLGPYADGAFCNTESSFIEPLIKRVGATDAPLDSGWVNTVARGCYCPSS